MKRSYELRIGVSAVVLAVGGCAAERPIQPITVPQPPSIVTDAARAEPQLRSTILGGEVPLPQPGAGQITPPLPGTITLNLPGAEVRTVAQSVQDVTGIPISVDPAANGQISLITPGPVARASVIGLFETALRPANLGLVQVGSGYIVQTADAARANGPIGTDAIGFGSEIITLQFINADQMRKVIDGLLPGVVTGADAARNSITIAGTTGQRASARDLLKQFDVNWLRNLNFALFVPQRTDSRLIVPELEKLINASDAPTRGLVRLISMERLNGILAVSSQRQYLDDVQRWIDILDREGESAEPRIYVYRVQNSRARDLARTLNAAFGNSNDSGGASNDDPFASDDTTNAAPDASSATAPASPQTTQQDGPSDRQTAAGGKPAQSSGQEARITADEVNNAVVVYGTPRAYAVVEDALRKLDVPPVQVLIEAAITEVSLTDSLRYGVQWNFQAGNANFAYSDGATTNPTRITPGLSFFFSNTDISATLNALEQRTNIKVISAPKLVVLNNQTAALQVGDQVPISLGTAVSVQNPDAPIVNSIEYRDTGVILKVTPRVNAGGMVLLDVAQEVSAVSQVADTSTTATGSSPTISTRRISTSVAVQDGQVIALGGLFRDTTTFGKNGIPILSRIPILGALFGNHQNSQNRTELIVLLKPHVIRTPDDGRAITEELRAKLRTLEPFKSEGLIP